MPHNTRAHPAKQSLLPDGPADAAPCRGDKLVVQVSGTSRHRGPGKRGGIRRKREQQHPKVPQKSSLGEEGGRNYGISLNDPPTSQYTENQHSFTRIHAKIQTALPN